MWPNHEPTLELLNEVRQGDDDARNRLLQRHRDAVHRLVKMRLDVKLQRRVDVSDVVQDVLLEANRRLGDYLVQNAMPFHLWLRQIAQDRIIDAHRRHRGSAKRSIDREQQLAPAADEASAIELVARLEDPELTPAAAVAQAELAQRVEQAIAAMDEGDAEVLVMRHYEHLSNQEVAQSLGLSEPAAGMRYLRAMRRLRELLKPGAGGESSA